MGMQLKMTSFMTTLSASSILLATVLTLLSSSDAAKFNVTNKCNYTVWAAATPGGGRQLKSGQSWSFFVPPWTVAARVWARTNCSFNAAGFGKCQTGDCGGVLQCIGYGQPPNTLAQFASNLFLNQEYIGISNIEGFNVPMEFASASPGCTSKVQCTNKDIISKCPTQLQVQGGCNGPCPVFKTDEHCCYSGNCKTTNFTQFFKEKCPDAYSYPKDYETSMFTCPGGTNYNVVFCP